MSPHATTPDTHADGSSPGDLVLTERIEASPDQIFDYLVEPEKLMRWMGNEARVEPTPGGSFWMDITGEDIAAGTYVEVDRPHRVVFTWGWEGSQAVPPGSTTVAIELRADGPETIVELTHSGLPGGENDEHRQGWTYYLDRLHKAATGQPVGPNAPGGAQ